MDWSNKDMSRMVQTYNANATGLELGTRLKATMLWGTHEFRCPLPEDPAAQSELIFPDHKQWFFMYMQPEKPFANRLRQTWREATLPPPARPDWAGENDWARRSESVPTAPEERTMASPIEQPSAAGTAVGNMLTEQPLGTALTSVTALARALEEGEKDAK